MSVQQEAHLIYRTEQGFACGELESALHPLQRNSLILLRYYLKRHKHLADYQKKHRDFPEKAIDNTGTFIGNFNIASLPKRIKQNRESCERMGTKLSGLRLCALLNPILYPISCSLLLRCLVYAQFTRFNLQC